MDCEFVGKIAPSTRGANGIDISDDIGHGYVRCRKFFHVAKLPWHPGNRSIVTIRNDAIAARAADRPQRIVVDLAASDHRNFRIKQTRQAAQYAALRLSS